MHIDLSVPQAAATPAVVDTDGGTVSGPGGVSLQVPRRRRIKSAEFIVFNQEMATLLKAGLPLVQSLDILRRRVPNPTFRAALDDIYERVRSGSALSDAFEAQGLNGMNYTIEFPKNGPTTVLLVFLASCPHCRATLPIWSGAFDKRPEGLKVQAIMLDEAPPGFFAFHKVTFPVLRAVDRRDVSQKLKVNRVPMTVRIKPGGVVEDVVQGGRVIPPQVDEPGRGMKDLVPRGRTLRTLRRDSHV